MKRFLQCKNCQQKTELTSEYITFCPHCGRKFDKNFPDWLKNHPEGTFEEYMKAVGADDESESKDHFKTQNTQTLFSKYKGAILILVVLVAAFMIKDMIKEGSPPGKTNKKELTGEWVTYSYGSKKKKLSSPWKLDVRDARPNEFESYLIDKEQYKIVSGAGLTVEVVTTVYDEEQMIRMNELIAGFIASMENMPGLTNHRYKTTNRIVGEIAGVLIDGEYTRQEYNTVYKCLLLIDKDIAYKLRVECNSKDDTGIRIMDRIIDSFELNYYRKSGFIS